MTDAEASSSKPYLRPDEVAELFRVHPDTVLRWLRQGKLKGTIRRGARLIAREEDERFL